MSEFEDADILAALNGADQEAEKPDAAGDGKKSAAVVLVELAVERYEFGCTEDGDPFAVALPDGHVVRMLVGGQVSLRTELASLYRAKTGRVAGQQALADAMLVLAGMAQEAEPSEVSLRVAAGTGGTVWLDVGDKAEHVVAVHSAGWEVRAATPGVRFRRTKLTGSLPIPVAGGDLTELWSLLNVAQADRPLVLAWLVAALVRPNIPHPVLALFGEQGTGKSSASKLLVSLVDPSPVPLRKPPKDPEAWVTAAAGSWTVGLDNLSGIPSWFSDSLCRAVTGEGDVRRALYTDGGLAVFSFRRVILLNGIDVGALSGDLADRAIMVNLDRLAETQRRTETQMAEAWTDAYPRILGALLSECCECLAALPSVRLGTSPRMADFAHVLAAMDARHGTDGLSRYASQARTLAEDSLDADPFLAAMRGRLHQEFIGTAADLLGLVTPEDGRTPRGWPSARGVTAVLKRNAPGLRKSGWQVEAEGRDDRARALSWRINPPEKAGNRHSRRSHMHDGDEPSEHASVASEESGRSQDDQVSSSGQVADPEVAGDPDPEGDQLDFGDVVDTAGAEAGACRGCHTAPTNKAGIGSDGLCLACDLRRAGVR